MTQTNRSPARKVLLVLTSHAELGGTGRRSRVAAGIAPELDETIGRAVDHGRLLEEAGRGADEAAHLLASSTVSSDPTSPRRRLTRPDTNSRSPERLVPR